MIQSMLLAPLSLISSHFSVFLIDRPEKKLYHLDSLGRALPAGWKIDLQTHAYKWAKVVV